MLDRNFRSVPTAGFPAGVFEAPTNPLIFINKNGSSTYLNKLEDKKMTLGIVMTDLITTPDDFILLFAWQGKFKTDVFEIKTSQVEIILKTL